MIETKLIYNDVFTKNHNVPFTGKSAEADSVDLESKLTFGYDSDSFTILLRSKINGDINISLDLNENLVQEFKLLIAAMENEIDYL